MRNEFARLIGKQIRSIRKDMNMTQTEFSKHFLGYAQNSYISNVEQGKINLTAEAYQKIFDFLDCSIEVKLKARIYKEKTI
jgi:transcriptional regulator with XRE-family HTH domain